MLEVQPELLAKGSLVRLAGVPFVISRLEHGEDGELVRVQLRPQGWRNVGRRSERRMLWAGALWRVKVRDLSVILERLEDQPEGPEETPGGPDSQ